MSRSNQPKKAAESPPVARDRRASVRYLSKLGASCQTSAEGKEERWPAKVHDISLEGLGLVAPRSFELGTLLGIDLQSPDGVLTYTMSARVVHAREMPEGKWQIGCSFSRKLTNEELKSLL